MASLFARLARIIGLILLLLVAGTGPEARTVKPKVPPGRDPGGVAVALIGAGLDYRRAEVASRLARDGEGEVIGWDFSDNDARPFSGDNADGRLAALALGDEAGAARLVLARVAPGRQDQIAAALRFTRETPARIVLLLADPGRPLAAVNLAEAARYLGPMMIVVPAHRVEGLAPGAVDELAGLLIVAGEAPGGAQRHADVAMVAPIAGPGEGTHADDLAAASLVARALRWAKDEPRADGAALRARLIGLAKVRTGAPPLLEGP